MPKLNIRNPYTFINIYEKNHQFLSRIKRDAYKRNKLVPFFLRHGAQIVLLTYLQCTCDGEQGHSGCVSCVKFSPDGSWLASAGEDSLVKVRLSTSPFSHVTSLRVMSACRWWYIVAYKHLKHNSCDICPSGRNHARLLSVFGVAMRQPSTSDGPTCNTP